MNKAILNADVVVSEAVQNLPETIEKNIPATGKVVGAWSHTPATTIDGADPIIIGLKLEGSGFYRKVTATNPTETVKVIKQTFGVRPTKS